MNCVLTSPGKCRCRHKENFIEQQRHRLEAAAVSQGVSKIAGEPQKLAGKISRVES